MPILFACAAPSLRLDVELLAEGAPLLLVLAGARGAAFRRAAAVGREAERQQPLLGARRRQVFADLAVELGDDVRRRAGGRDNGEEAAYHPAPHGFVQRWQVW